MGRETLFEAADEKRPVVAFLRRAGWPDERIKAVVDAHKRGETYKATLTLGPSDWTVRGE